jgi:hypothetical protein
VANVWANLGSSGRGHRAFVRSDSQLRNQSAEVSRT